MDSNKGNKEVDILLKELELDWQDHFEIRKQSWNTVIASGALIVGLLSMNKFPFDNGVLMTSGCLGLMALSIFGLLVAKHHRQCEREKFAYIRAIERLLPIHINGVQKSLYDFLAEIRESRFNTGFGSLSTSSFIVCYHCVVLLFSVLFFSVLMSSRVITILLSEFSQGECNNVILSLKNALMTHTIKKGMASYENKMF